MPQGDKSAYTSKQKRKAAHIEEGYEKRGKSAARAKQIAYATVNKEDGGGKKSGSGRKETGVKKKAAKKTPAKKAPKKKTTKKKAKGSR